MALSRKGLLQGKQAFVTNQDDIKLLNIARTFFAVPLASQRFFGPALFAGLEIERMTLDFFYDIFLLNLTFETAQSAFERFAVLQMDFCQLRTHHLST